MSHAVVVVGPTSLRGPHAVDAELAELALEGIDENLLLVEDVVVTADQLWRNLFEVLLGGSSGAVTLVVPSWWPGSRVARIETAARTRAANVTVRRRVDVWPSDSAIVEIAPDLVVVHADARRHAVARIGPSAAIVAAVVACVTGLCAVTVDVPTGLASFGAELGGALRRCGIAVTTVEDRALERALRVELTDAAAPPTRRRRISPRGAVLAGSVLTVATLVAAALVLDDDSGRAVADGTWLVEGRVAVEIPANWTVERVTSGPGSARVAVVSPSDHVTAIHVTQSQVPDDQTLDATGEQLRLALAEEPDGVFVDFTARGRRAERPVVSYREVRADHHVAWAVLLDRGVRIAIGCQSPPGGAGLRQLCDRAVRTAHAVS